MITRSENEPLSFNTITTITSDNNMKVNIRVDNRAMIAIRMAPKVTVTQYQ